MLVFALIFRAIKKAFDAAQPRPEILEEFHGVRERIKVGDERVKFDWSFVKGTSKENLIVFMHGFGSDELQWLEPGLFSSKQILVMEDLLDEEPNVLTVSLGKSWLISDDNDRRRGERDATVDYVLGAIDAIEKRFFPDGAKNRLLFGVSMGGFNALKLYTHKPELFKMCMVMNPCLKDPSDARKMPADLLLDGQFKDEEIIEQSPNYSRCLDLIKPEHPPLKIFSALRDEFGFYKATKDFHEKLLEKKVNSSFIESPGGHHDFEPIIAATMVNELFVPPPVEPPKKEPEPPEPAKPEPEAPKPTP